MKSDFYCVILRITNWPTLCDDIFDAQPLVVKSSAFWVAAGIAAHQTGKMNDILQELFQAACRQLKVSNNPDNYTFLLRDKNIALGISKIISDGIQPARAKELLPQYQRRIISSSDRDRNIEEIAIQYVCFYLRGVSEA